MPPLPADSIHARACKLKCEKILTRPASGIEVFEFAEQVGLQPFALLNRDEIQRRCFPDQLVLKI